MTGETKSMSVRNPRTGAFDYEIKPASAPQVEAAVARARAAQPAWHALDLETRRTVLDRFMAVLLEGRADLLEALSADTGRRKISDFEIQGLPATVGRWFDIAKATQLGSSGTSSMIPTLTYDVDGVVYPVVGVISPWNFPLTLSFIDAVPALMAGAAVVIKPSEVTPRFAAPVRAAISKVPELDGILQILDGDGQTGSALVGAADFICFTGSLATGRKVAALAAERLIPVCLELGGKDPAIVLKTVDIDRSAKALVRASVVNTGQACQSIERIYVDASIHDAFLDALVREADKVTLSAEDPGKGQLGPVIFDRQADILQCQIEDAVAKGATVLTGGQIETYGGGRWCRPTVLSGVTHDMLVMQEETFGPLLPVMAFETEEEAVKLANDTPYGLSGAVLAGDVDEARRVGAQINAGAISLQDGALTSVMHEAEKNAFKGSGLGPSRMGPQGYKRFFRSKAFISNLGDPLPLAMFDEESL